MRTRRSGRWATSSASLVAVGLIVLATCVVLNEGDAGAIPFTTAITGTCALPQGGSAPLTASVSAAFPDSVPVGQPVPATDLAITMTLSPQLTDTLRTAGGTAVGAGVDTVLVAKNGAAAQDLTVPHLTATTVALPASGPLTLTLAGQVPSTTPAQGGSLAVLVTSLTPTLTMTTAGADDPAPTGVACTMDAAQADQLATVPVAGDAPAVATPLATTAPAADPTIFVSYFLDGRTTLRKLGSDLVLNRGRFDATVDLTTGAITGMITLPPARGTFLGFGFVPVSATTTFTEQGQATGTFANGIADVTARLVLGLSDTDVNGTALAAGSGCRTAQPAVVEIKGTLNLLGTSNFVSSLTIPNLEGCGATENLDPLFDGLVAGPGNTLDTTLTLRCSATDCPPDS